MANFDTPGIFWDQPGLYYDAATPGSVIPKPMKKVKLSTSKLKPNETADLTDAIVANMTGNASFPTPAPTLASLTAKAAAVRVKRTLLTNMESDLTTERGLLADLTGDLKLNLAMLADYVQDESDGDPNKIHSAGMQVMGERTPVGPMPPVENLKVSMSDAEGTLNSEWQPVFGAFVYLVEMAPAPDGPWTQMSATTKARHTLTNLTPGTKYWVRVRAVGAAGSGPYSDVACRMAA